ncbi:hypothetical protein L218DRAFT_502480 [Marasmius fiardii PR-910]|nr:hypothetical protein L218DRAFT_502480 [Marasmius fiardii PR-910]
MPLMPRFACHEYSYSYLFFRTISFCHISRLVSYILSSSLLSELISLELAGSNLAAQSPEVFSPLRVQSIPNEDPPQSAPSCSRQILSLLLPARDRRHTSTI